MSRRKRSVVIILLVLLLLLVPPAWITYREWKQARLDHSLIEAIKAEDDQKALEALAEGANGEARDIGAPPTFRETLLHLLDRFRHPGQKKSDKEEHVPALLLLYQDAYVKTPASESRRAPGPNIALVRALLDHGAQSNDQDSQGCSPLWYASFFSSRDTVRLLMERGANPNAVDYMFRDTPIIGASAGVTEELLEHGADINAVDANQDTALTCAAFNGETDVVRILLEHGANIDAADQDKRTALLDGVYKGSPDLVRLLLEHGADTEARDSKGDTALLMAAGDYHISSEMVRLLLEHGAKVNAKASDGHTALAGLLQEWSTQIDKKDILYRNDMIKINYLRMYGAK